MWGGGLNRRSSPGQSLVELALTMPLFLLLVMGIIDLGWVLYAHVQVAAASGVGARAGAYYPGDYTADISRNRQDREQVVRLAIVDTSTSPPSSALGLLSTSPPSFNLASDVTFFYPGGLPSDPANTPWHGEEMVVTVKYRQPVWFDFLPGISSGRIEVSSSTRVRIQ